MTSQFYRRGSRQSGQGSPVSAVVSRKFSVTARVSLTVLLLAGSWFPALGDASLDRLRIHITTSSDWTALRLTGGERFIAWSATPLSGAPGFQSAADSLRVTQPLADAQAGRTVSVQFDVLLQSTNPPVIGFESTRGNIGTTVMDFFRYNTNPPVWLNSVTNAVTSGHPNARLFWIPGGWLLGGELGWPRPAVPPLVLAFYYPWYSFDSWASATLADQPPQPYHSDSPITLARHLHLAKTAGLDGFISSWWGPGSGTDRNLQRLLDLAGTNFVVSIYFETLTGDPPQARPESDLLAWLRYFFQTYGSHPRLLRYEGKPVIFIWAAGAAPADVWQRVFATLRSEGHDAIYSANTLNAAYLDVFDGLHDYGPALRGGLEADYQQASTACRVYGWLEDTPQLKFWAATAQPGYDDRLIPGRAGAFVDRLAGATYTRTLDTSLASAPDWLLVTSFNEWWENTHIEPSVHYGNLHLGLTAQYADRFKGVVQPRPVAEFNLPAVSRPDGRVWLSWEAPHALAPNSYTLYRSSAPFTNTTGLTPLAAGLTETGWADYPPGEGRIYYAVAPEFGGEPGPLSEVKSCYVHTNKRQADPAQPIPVDIALYVDSTSWISSSVAQNIADLLVQQLAASVGQIERVNGADLPNWLLSHTANGQLDVLLTFGDIPDSVYPSGNTEPDRSLAEAFLDDGNLILNTGDYLFYGRGRNGTGGLMTVMDAPAKLVGDDIPVQVTPDGARFTPSLAGFQTDRPFRLTNLLGSDWQFELTLADNGGGWADPVVVRNDRTGGRLGIVYQTQDDALPRAQVLSELLTNWLPTVAQPAAASSTVLLPQGSVWRYFDTGANLGTAWRAAGYNDLNWSSGPAMLGFGDANGLLPATLIASNRQITTYFRRTFLMANLAEVVGLRARLLRDDGAVVYLNGTEVWRDNLDPNLPVTYTSPALVAISGSGESSWLTRQLPPGLLRAGVNQLAVEIHQNVVTSSDVVFDFELQAAFSPWPVVAISTPDPDSVLLPQPTLVAATATSPAARFEFFVDGVKLWETTDGSSSWTWPATVPGEHQLQTVVTDVYGRSATSAVVTVTVARLLSLPLIAPHAGWKFFDAGVDLGEAWRSLAFDDAAWPAGPAPLGFGDGDEATLLSRTSAGGDTNITFYFRHLFFVPDAAALSQLNAHLVRDDGAVVYLNGMEIWRDNMPAGPVTHDTPANAAIGGSGESAWLTKTLGAAVLQTGTNLLAVEIHQNSITSSDVSFDFELIASVALAEGPRLTVTPVGGDLVLSWPDDFGLFSLQTATDLVPPVVWLPVSTDAVASNGWWLLPLPVSPGGRGFYRLQNP